MMKESLLQLYADWMLVPLYTQTAFVRIGEVSVEVLLAYYVTTCGVKVYV